MNNKALTLFSLAIACVTLSDPLSATAQGVDKLKRGVVKITAKVEGQTKVGTGFIVRIDKDATYVVTAAHVIEGDPNPQITFIPQPQQSFMAQVIGSEGGEEKGLAALRIAEPIPQGVVALALDQTSQIVGGEAVTFIGFPRSLPPWTVSTGSLSGLKGPALAFQALVEEGHSGGPLLLNGRVIGMVSDARERLGYAVPTAILVVALIGWGIEARPSEAALTREIIGVDGAPMVLIPAGQYQTNEEIRLGNGTIETDVQYKVYVDEFYIDKYEVTIARYLKFMNATGRTAPEYWEKIDAVRDGNRPVVGVTWHDAASYCRWAKKRLPSEDEWEKSARGTDGRTYPWDNDQPIPQFTNFGTFGDFVFDKLLPVGSFEKDSSPYGVHDLAGNVSEWTADNWRESKREGSGSEDANLTGRRVVRGGAWNATAEYLRAALRTYNLSDSADPGLGFRCAREGGLAR
jgi:formylglycine-generating enzyme required for sulfatase activity